MINIEVSKYASFNPKKTPHPDNDIHIFTQFFIHKNPARYAEIKHCLRVNASNPHITKIHLLNERIYTDAELGGVAGDGSGKIIQTDIGKRLTFKDIFKYIRLNVIAGYCAFTNADIFFDLTINKIRYTDISVEKQMLALLRYEYRGGSDLDEAVIFGPRADSQDTWIVHFSKMTGGGDGVIGGGCGGVTSPIGFKESHEKALDIAFGMPGCDNKITYVINILGGEIINDPRFIKTYHYHVTAERDYSAKNVIAQPYTVVHPAGFNVYLSLNTLGIVNKNVVETTAGFQKIRFSENNVLYDYISEKLARGENFIIPRISGHENNFAFLGNLVAENVKNGVQPAIPGYVQKYFQSCVPIMKRNAGIQLSNITSIVNYSVHYLKAFHNCDLYGAWESWGNVIPHIADSHAFIERKFADKRKFWAFVMDIYHYIYSRPFTIAMRGKRILIVSPFCESMRAKIPIRAELYDGVDLFPDCTFVFIMPPMTNGDNHADEFDVEFARFTRRLDELRGQYDVALLSCGGYANPIANYIYENHGASAIYVGGVLQMYFGIYGGRWLKERTDVLKLFMNSQWSRPLNSEKPANHSSIENSCYW